MVRKWLKLSTACERHNEVVGNLQIKSTPCVLLLIIFYNFKTISVKCILCYKIILLFPFLILCFIFVHVKCSGSHQQIQPEIFSYSYEQDEGCLDKKFKSLKLRTTLIYWAWCYWMLLIFIRGHIIFIVYLVINKIKTRRAIYH